MMETGSSLVDKLCLRSSTTLLDLVILPCFSVIISYNVDQLAFFLQSVSTQAPISINVVAWQNIKAGVLVVVDP